jgi:thermolysin
MTRGILVVLLGALLAPGWAECRDEALRVVATSRSSVQEWSGRVDQLLASGDLGVRLVRKDTMIPGRQHERLAQLHQGVPVFGGELIRQSDLSGTLTVFGMYYEGIGVEVEPTLGPRQIEGLLAERGGRPFADEPELLVLPLEGGGYRLAYRVRAFFEEPFDVRQYFFDARSGEVLLEYRDIHTQTAGAGTGVLGDRKKVSVTPSGGQWQTKDQLRPPVIATYDFGFDVNRLIRFLNAGGRPSDLTDADLGSDADNVWTDGALVDAHVYAGYTYDYYFERFGRRGLDDANIPIRSITHALRREDWRLYHPDTVDLFFLNAFYLGQGVMYYGDGLPANVTLYGKRWNYFAGALDVVAHELSHGVIDYTSRLIYSFQSGALSEAFCDIMATSVEFYAQPEKADYLAGEDVVRPGAVRSLANPRSFGDPAHIADAYHGPADNGGVHINSTIVSHAFYLAIEGGESAYGDRVRGVGGGNRQQIERVFYRAFTTLLPPHADFVDARDATIQAARELYPDDAAVERAIVEAWAAVGLNLAVRQW